MDATEERRLVALRAEAFAAAETYLERLDELMVSRPEEREIVRAARAEHHPVWMQIVYADGYLAGLAEAERRQRALEEREATEAHAVMQRALDRVLADATGEQRAARDRARFAAERVDLDGRQDQQ